MDYLLNDKDIMKLCGRNTKIVTYPEISDYTSLSELFGKDDKVVILYVNEMDANSVTGHWCLLTRVVHKNKVIIEFLDPYGMMPDEQLSFYDENWKENSNQDENYLTRLLYEASINPEVEIQYNETVLQGSGRNVNTCGRVIGLRAMFYKVPLDKYQKLWKEFKSRGNNIDKAAVTITDAILKK